MAHFIKFQFFSNSRTILLNNTNLSDVNKSSWSSERVRDQSYPVTEIIIKGI